MSDNEKTTPEHWEHVYLRAPRLRLPLPVIVSTMNLERLLRRHVRPGMQVLEIGCAPGKYLAWVARRLGAHVTGVDYSARGLSFCRRLFAAVGVEGDLYCEDVFKTTLPDDRFDLVYSVGVIEHFEDPRPIVAKHVALTRPGGRTLMVIPNYAGIYGRLQGYFDADNLALHNLGIMDADHLRALAPPGRNSAVQHFGRLDPWLVNFERRWPMPLARLTAWTFNMVGLLQFGDVRPVSPWLVLTIDKAEPAR
jgi:2-polyprenyl-3-methyl-5-hydroxy-6-metoxy-1,4-benzoquinol methylase